MDKPQKNSKPISPAAAICFGVLCFGLASLILWSGIADLMAGKTHTIGKGGTHSLIIQQDTRGEFWFWIAGHFLGAIIVYTGAVLIFVSGSKRIRNDDA
jgi:hypothetical protein